MKLTRLAPALVLIAVAGSAFASDITGNWTGKIELGNITLPANFTAEQKKQMEPMIAQQKEALKKASINFVFKKGGTYTATSVGMPNAGKPSTGKWALKGSTLTITPDAKEGKMAGGPKSMSGDVASNGKAITFSVKSPGGEMKIILKR